MDVTLRETRGRFITISGNMTPSGGAAQTQIRMSPPHCAAALKTIKGQEYVKSELEVAAAGSHNVLTLWTTTSHFQPTLTYHVGADAFTDRREEREHGACLSIPGKRDSYWR